MDTLDFVVYCLIQLYAEQVKTEEDEHYDELYYQEMIERDQEAKASWLNLF